MSKSTQGDWKIRCGILLKRRMERLRRISGIILILQSPPPDFFLTRNSTKDGFESIEPTDFSTFEKDDLEHVGWYYIPVENKKPTWMNPYLNQNINVSMISYVVPIYMENESVGIIGMDISLETIENMISEASIYENGYSCLVDTNHIVAHKEYQLGTA